MKNISQKSWFSVSIELNNDYNLDFIYSQFYNHMVGSTENNHEFIFYFESDSKKIINGILDTELMGWKFKIEDIQYQKQNLLLHLSLFQHQHLFLQAFDVTA